ncbi:hypothetical protein BHE74_00059771 [Ensete ventricosum]|nr:hypothetical protein BHE74_00059771 [Ensete ventricosum]
MPLVAKAAPAGKLPTSEGDHLRAGRLRASRLKGQRPWQVPLQGRLLVGKPPKGVVPTASPPAWMASCGQASCHAQAVLLCKGDTTLSIA